MKYEPHLNDFVTTVSFTRGRITRIQHTESGCVLVVRVKDLRSQTVRDIYVSPEAIIKVARNQIEYAIVRRRARHEDNKMMLPMSTAWAEQEYGSYARNRPIQNNDTDRDTPATSVPAFLKRETRVAGVDSLELSTPAA